MIHAAILMYHGIIKDNSDIPSDREIGADLYDVPWEQFKHQMEAIRGENVTITFDDGERNNIINALPILRQMGYMAYFFVTVDRIGKKGYLSWEEVKELRDAGMVIGSHGLTHRILTEIKKKELEEELFGSKDILERNLSIAVDSLSIPRGFYDESVIKVAKEAGFTKIFGSDPVQKHPSVLPRIAVKSDWDKERFQMALKGEIPLKENVSGVFKQLIKKSLGDRGYDRFRSFILGRKK